MSPLPNIEHQALVSGLNTVLTLALSHLDGVRVFPGINVSDRRDGWEQNYRCPDVAVVLPGSQAIDCGPFFLGGPDFAVEVTSDYDRSKEKLDFYAAVNVRELLVVDRNPWQLELFRWQRNQLLSVGISDLTQAHTLASEVLPLVWRLVSRPAARPSIEVSAPATNQLWLI